MEKSSSSSGTGPKPEDTRAGGPDDTRKAGERQDTSPTPDNTRAGGPDDTRAGGPDDTRGGGTHQGAPAEDQDNIPRGAPVDSRSFPR
jgi:hypothetical protein